MSIRVSYENRRGCGYRSAPGALYLVADAPNAACGKLPFALTVCPTCHAGVKPSRSWTWIDGDAIVGPQVCAFQAIGRPDRCGGCPLSSPGLGRVGLLWIGEKFYATPEDYLAEARLQGISRRIPAVPKDFKVGETLVLLAHRLAITQIGPDGPVKVPGIFSAFRPRAVEVIVDGTEDAEKIASYEARGLEPVQVVRRGEQHPLFPPTTTPEGGAHEHLDAE